MWIVNRTLGLIAALWIFSAIQGTSHPNPSWISSSGDIPSSSKFHSTLIQAPQPQDQVDDYAPAPALDPIEVPSIGRVEPIFSTQSLSAPEVILPRPKIYLFFPTGLSPPRLFAV